MEELELEKRLAVFDKKRNVMGADLEDGAGALRFTEAVVEEACVVGPKFADADIVGGHDGGEM